MPALQLKMYDSLKRGLVAVSQQPLSRLSEPEIRRHFVRSNSIATLGHDETRQCLQVEYFNGILYRVDDVSEQKYKSVRDAEDFDHTFREEIFAHHPMTRIGYILPVYG